METTLTVAAALSAALPLAGQVQAQDPTEKGEPMTVPTA